MPINDYKEITVPVNGTDKAVKMIQDSNGNIIWGSQSAFPYRRLEYIHFNGNDWINSQFDPWNNCSLIIDICWDANNEGTFNGHGRNVVNNRLFIGVESGSKKIMFGSGASSPAISNSDPYNRHTYQVTTSTGTGKAFIDGTQVWSGSSNFVESNRGKIYIGGVYRSTGDYSPVKAKIYNVKFINNYSTNPNNVVWNWIPVQRKSDGAIGFLKLKSSGATPDFMQSVNGLLEAGPVVDEYWNQTA